MHIKQILMDCEKSAELRDAKTSNSADRATHKKASNMRRAPNCATQESVEQRR
jgi:hypothetical protein